MVTIVSGADKNRGEWASSVKGKEREIRIAVTGRLERGLYVWSFGDNHLVNCSIKALRRVFTEVVNGVFNMLMLLNTQGDLLRKSCESCMRNKNKY